MNDFALWVRTIGVRAPLPVGALMLMVGGAAHFGLLQGLGLRVAAGFVVALVMTIPLAAIWTHVPGETSIERRTRELRQTRSRAELAAGGLTPEEYIATIPVGDVIRRAEAAERFGVELRAGRVR